jgi:hypothetical protein
MTKDAILVEEDLHFLNGDFLIDESTEQHLQHLLKANEGEYKQWPFMGIGILKNIKQSFNPMARLNLEREILLQLEADGVKNAEVNVSEEGVITFRKATYE